MLDGVLGPIPLALFSYGKSPTDLEVLQSLRTREIPPGELPSEISRSVFWGYWRDLSSYDLFALLNLVDTSKRGDFDAIFRRFWRDFVTKGRARTWENVPRKPRRLKAPGVRAESLNAWLAVRHCGLLSSDGRVTTEGLSILRVGKIYGPGSIAFLEKLGYQVLTSGRHLELIFWVEEQQRLISKYRKRNAASYYRAIDKGLVQKGIIPPRPNAPSKQYFFRDEPKLWNKLGFVIRQGKTRYFHPGHGLAFNWRKIIGIIGGDS